MEQHNIFPNDFLWGVATSAFQIEGATNEDGRGSSIWDDFCRQPSRVNNNDNGDIACGHYHHYQKDIDLIKNLGVKAYRFSIAWPRIFPEGEGQVNSLGLDFYSRLIDGLLEKDIIPYITLYHWDLPSSLQKKYDGWFDEKITSAYEQYVRTIAKNFGDRVKNWITHNEITCFTRLSCQQGRQAPGSKRPVREVNQMVHHSLVAHGKAVLAIREEISEPVKIGLVQNIASPWPVYHTKEHLSAAKKAFYAHNQDVLFPLLTGKYDQRAYEKLYESLPEHTEEEMKLINTPIDFIGYNIYFGFPVMAADNEESFEVVDTPATNHRNFMNWPVFPKCIYYGLTHSRDFFPNMDIFITENGMPCDDKELPNGEIHDLDRLEYYRTHLEMCARAIKDGCPLKGYFAWSLMDNFEWAEGYSKRFGLYRVNYSTLERKLKLSGKYYQHVIEKNAVL